MSGAEAVDHALERLVEHLELRLVHEADSHTALCLFGLDDDVVIDALGMHLVGLLAGIVRTNLKLSDVFLAQTPAGRAQLLSTVAGLLQPSATASDEAVRLFGANVRDPWIAEAIGHALLAVRGRADTQCLDGQVVATTVPHPQPSQQGFDLFAIYNESGLPAIALGEVKASRANGSARLTQASGFFRRVQDGDRDVDILMQVTILRGALEPGLERGGQGAGRGMGALRQLPQRLVERDLADRPRGRRCEGERGRKGWPREWQPPTQDHRIM